MGLGISLNSMQKSETWDYIVSPTVASTQDDQSCMNWHPRVSKVSCAQNQKKLLNPGIPKQDYLYI